ncbi:hypothetical protein BDV35DRAFT_294808 [Aspergillus flavus]|uniref:Uncharacterized protein n=1 Tax=Aspergillus flavus TaxID=5059 RepID=A0A5N6HC58_ASPFL|nr:hypothetical protein BDV35DRAFT_294808 [Aspergillus flavus]
MNDWETYSTIIDLIFYRVDLPVGNGTLVVDFHLNWLPFCPFGLRVSLWLLFFLFSFFFFRGRYLTLRHILTYSVQSECTTNPSTHSHFRLTSTLLPFNSTALLPFYYSSSPPRPPFACSFFSLLIHAVNLAVPDFTPCLARLFV